MAIINITKEIFEEQILKADQPVLVDFWAPWCTYCRRIAPTFDKIAEQQEDKLVFAKVNVDEAPEIAEKYGIDTIPTLLLFKNGEVSLSIKSFKSLYFPFSFLSCVITSMTLFPRLLIAASPYRIESPATENPASPSLMSGGRMEIPITRQVLIYSVIFFGFVITEVSNAAINSTG